MKVNDFLTKLTNMEKELQDTYKNHPAPNKLKGGIRAHLPGSEKMTGCIDCVKMKKQLEECIEFEKTHLGFTRMDKASIENTIIMMRNIIIMMKESGEI